MPRSIEELLADAGLTGRGGAAYPTARKVASARANGAGLIVNACDGELDAAKDWYVVAHHLDELVHGASLLSADVRYAARRGSATLDLLVNAGLSVLEVPDRYVASEESALVSLAHGGLAQPVSRQHPVVFGGHDSEGRRLSPTVVLNAETVWRTSQLARFGAAWFRSIGTAAEPGPRLVTVVGAVARPGVLELPAGIPVEQLLARAGASRSGAVGVGGLSGGFLSLQEALRLRWDTTELALYGCRIGSGVVRVIGATECPVDRVAHTVAYAAGESAGQCGPCMFGLPAVAADFAALAAGDGRGLAAIHRRLELLPGRGACRFPDGVAGYVASALRVFAADIEAHLTGRCVAAEVGHAPAS